MVDKSPLSRSHSDTVEDSESLEVLGRGGITDFWDFWQDFGGGGRRSLLEGPSDVTFSDGATLDTFRTHEYGRC